MKKLKADSKRQIGGYTTYRKAFTLIELLVVIAIIGILATVVIASLNSAREKGRIANIKSNLRNAVTQGELYHSENNYSYTGICGNSKIQEFISAINAQGAQVNCYSYVGSHFLAPIDWGIGVIYKDMIFTSSPRGVISIDNINTGSETGFSNALNNCSSAGKRLLTLAELKSLYDIGNTVPLSFTMGTTSGYWAINDYSSTNAFYIAMANGTFSQGAKTLNFNVRCGM